MAALRTELAAEHHEQASLPASLPHPDLTHWMAAGAAAVVAVALFCELAGWLVLRAGGVKAGLAWTGATFPQESQFWRLAEYEDFSAAAKLAPPAWVAWASASGPLLLLALPWAAGRWNNRWLFAASAGVAGRLLAPLFYLIQVVLAWFRGEGVPRMPGLEEYRLWVLLGLPVGFSLLVETVVVAAGVVVVARHRREPRTHRFCDRRSGYHHTMSTASIVIFAIAIAIVAVLALRAARRR
mgnify:CR=1 FL=1